MTFAPPSTLDVPKKDHLDNRLRNDLWRLASEGRILHPAYGDLPHKWTIGELAKLSDRSPRMVRLGIAESKARAGILADVG